MSSILTRSLTGGQVVQRADALDFNGLSQLLPNPDPILKATGQQVKVYRELARDSHVGACIRRRKGAVAAMQWGVDRGLAPSRVGKAITAMIEALDMERIIGDALEATLYGYAPMEINWATGPGGPFSGIWPADLVALPPEWFCFDADCNLRFKTRTEPVYGELLPDRKFLLPRQDATYQNPYGLGDLALCWWPVTFKKGGMRFWLQFAEKYGGAFLIGKLPRGTENAEWVKLQSSLENLIQNGVGVIADDSSIAPLEAGGKQASTDLYERLVMYCRSEISIVLTGTNQTVEVSANKASAYAGMDVAGDLRDANARMVETMVNRLIRWTVDLNWPGAPAPVFTMWDQQNRDAVQAARDKSNFEAGARFTKSFWVANYGYRDTDLVDVRTPPPDVPALPGAKPPGPRNAIAFAAAASLTAADKPDPTAALQDQLGAAAAPAWGTLLDQVGALVQAAPDLATLQTTLVDAYGGLDTAALTKLMAAAFALAELQGMVAAQADAAAGGA